MNIFTLMGTVLIDNAKANDSISKTGKEADSLAGKVGKGIATVGKVGLAVGTAVGAGAAALTGLAMKSAETADRIDKMSNKIGISKGAFQEWDYVLGQNGMDIEKMQVGMKTLTAAMDGASSGSKGAIENFQKLGLTWQDGSGKLKSQEDMMNETLMALAGMENGTEKARLATELFGKSGVEMMPMLNGGAEGIEELKNRAHELGLVMSDESVTAGVVLGDTMDDVKASLGMVATVIGVEIMPIVQKMLDWFLANMPQIQAVFSTVFDVVGAVVMVAADGIGVFVGWIQNLTDKNTESGILIASAWEIIQGMFATTFEVINGLFTAFSDFCGQFWNEWGLTISEYLGGAFAFWGIIFQTAFDVIMSILRVFTALFNGEWGTAWNELLVIFSTIWNGISEALSIWLETLITLIKNIAIKMLEAGKELFTNLWNGFIEIWTLVTGWVADGFLILIGMIVGFAKNLFESAKTLFNSLWNGFKTIWASISLWVTTTFSGVVTTIKGFATQMFEAGKSIISNVWLGMKDVWKSVSTWVLDRAKDIADTLMFWKDSEEEKEDLKRKSRDSGADGSNANGLDYVPFDGYRSILHKGERVLTAEENEGYNARGNSGATINNYFYGVQEKDTAFKAQRATKKALRELAL